MCAEWHEFAAAWEVGSLKGNIGYAPLPKGPARSANMYGGTGIGVNTYASEDEQKAAWLFVAWATSREAQLMDLKSSVGGGPHWARRQTLPGKGLTLGAVTGE